MNPEPDSAMKTAILYIYIFVAGGEEIPVLARQQYTKIPSSAASAMDGLANSGEKLHASGPRPRKKNEKPWTWKR